MLGLYHTRLPPEHFPGAEQDKRRYTLYLELLGGSRIAVYIHLYDPYGFPKALLNLFQYGRHHFAGAAPGGEKVDEYQLIAVD